MSHLRERGRPQEVLGEALETSQLIPGMDSDHSWFRTYLTIYIHFDDLH